MKTVVKHCKTNWKTILAGLIIAIFTLLLWRKQISVEEWIAGIGSINTILLLLFKDQDKNKP